MKFENKPYIIDKVVVYDDNGNKISCNTIHKTESGEEYYYPTNTNPGAVLGLFSGRIKDAVECIRDGYGDVISVGGWFKTVSVIRYLNREYGESLREKSIEGWKNAEFEYAIKFSFINSFSGGYTVDKNGKGTYDNKDILTFPTEELANEHISKLVNLANDYYTKYCNISGDEDAIDELLTNMKNDGYDASTVLFDMFYGMEQSGIDAEKKYIIQPIQVLSQKDKTIN